MLYIFHVDTGTTITFDIKFALQSVAQLKEAIERECGVVASQQVLLMSGGESLEPNARVCSYSAGTDTNPIYLFSKAAIESHIPPTPSIDYGSDVDLQNQIDASLAMPATYQTLVARAQLAQQCCGLAREQTRICERLVHDQHLQQQGWAAVVANLEDITQMFQSRADLLQQSFSLYLAERQQHMELLENFNADLGTLAKIPILPALRAQAEGILSPDDQQQPQQQQQPGQQSDADAANGQEVLSLFRWISAKDNQSSLEQVAEQCSRGLEQFDERVMEALKAEVSAAIDAAKKHDMKEIKGLGERLFALEQLMVQTKRLVHEQGELAQGFLQNQNRANNLGDASVLPDLCTSHRRQLLVMLQNHNQLRDIRRRCTKAKEELSVNIYHRLKWIMYVENKMMEVDSKLVIYHESLKRLRRHLEVLQQIHLAPQMYMTAVAEVVRRRTFSQAFLVWASNLACQLLTVHTEELARRREFQGKFEGHFLNTLFPGLEDTPPPFATEAPSVFDNALPKLTATDMDSLKSQLPELALTISTPDLDSITQFFLSKSLTETCNEGGKDNKEVGTSEDGGGMRVESTGKDQSRTRATMLTDRGGFESETDTEEFEKIGQVAGDSKPGSFDSVKQHRQKQLEENLGNTREEVERLRSILKTMKAVVCEALTSVREELSVLKDRSNSESSGLSEMTERIRETLSLYSRECDRRLREREQELTVDHELELADVKKLLQAREEEIRTIKRTLLEKETELGEHERLVTTMRQKLEDGQSEMRAHQKRLHHQLEDALEQIRAYQAAAVKKMNDERYLEKCFQCQKRIQELEKSLATARSEKERAVKEATDKLQLEYKTELERSRYKPMAASTMERSPSDSSLEKIERPDVIEIANHEAILAQAKVDMNIEKSEAILTAIEKERADCVAKLDHELRLARQVVEEKEREVEMCRIREVTLVDKCKRYKTMIRRLSKSENVVRQTLNEKVVDSLDAEGVWIASKIASDRAKLYEQKESGASMMMENPLRKEFSEESLEEALKCVESDKDDVEVSGSKKVRLESDDEAVRLSRTLDLLEKDNKRLNSELQTTRESKEAAEAKVEALEADKVRLEVELVKERSKRGYVGESSSSSEDRDKDMTASVAVVPESAFSKDAATSPAEPVRRSTAPSCLHSSVLLHENVAKNAAKLVQQGRITVTRCNPGDIVLVFWDPAHENYTLYQESPTLYFLNSDCVAAVDLTLNPDGSPRRYFIMAEVINKEYCHARKTENRYRVPLGTKFYRVRVKAIEDTLDMTQMVKSQQQQQQQQQQPHQQQ